MTFSWISKAFIAMLIISSLLFTGCDRMKKAIDATARLAAQVNSLEQQTEKSFDAGLIDKATALKITLEIKDHLNPSVGLYVDFVEKLRVAYPANGSGRPTAVDWATARALFQAVESSFQQILVMVGALSQEKSALISVAIATLIEILDLIRGAFAGAQHYIGGPTNVTA